MGDEASSAKTNVHKPQYMDHYKENSSTKMQVIHSYRENICFQLLLAKFLLQATESWDIFSFPSDCILWFNLVDLSEPKESGIVFVYYVNKKTKQKKCNALKIKENTIFLGA